MSSYPEIGPDTQTANAGRPAHGGIRPAQLRALGLNPAQVLDFSASISPLGPPPGLWPALQQVDLTAYPDPECLELREALARRLDAAPAQILVGNGSTELIHLLARAWLSPPPAGCANSALLLTPTYGEYAGAVALVGAAVMQLPAQRSDGFSWDLEQAATLIARERPALVFLCNPNNPTGVYLNRPAVTYLAQCAAAAGSLLALDEAYVSFVADAWNSLPLTQAGHVLLLRSMTKDYALTGLRLGYGVAAPEVIARLAQYQPDWSVNGLALAAGLAALSDAAYLNAARQAVNDARVYLTERLGRLGFGLLPSAANFLVAEVGDGSWWRDRLMRRGLFVRDCASFGLADCIRIGLRPLNDCQRLADAMAEISRDEGPAPAGRRAPAPPGSGNAPTFIPAGAGQNNPGGNRQWA